MSIKIPNGRKELPEDLQKGQVDTIKLFLTRLAGLTYLPHNTPEDDEEMERLVAEFGSEVFKEAKNKSPRERLFFQIQSLLEIEEKLAQRLKDGHQEENGDE